MKVGKFCCMNEENDINGSVSLYLVIYNWEEFIILRIVKVCLCSLYVYINVIFF